MSTDGSDPDEHRAEPDDAVPEPHGDKAHDTSEVTPLPPEEASKVAAEIRAVAEQRGEDEEAAELIEIQKSGPMPTVAPIDDDALSGEELRDAWPLLDLDERGDGLRVLPREEAEDFFIALSAGDQAAFDAATEPVPSAFFDEMERDAAQMVRG